MKIWPFRRRSVPAPQAVTAAPEPALTPAPLRIAAASLDVLAQQRRGRASPFVGLPVPPPGVRPPGAPARTSLAMAMDDASGSAGGAWGTWATQGMWGEGLAFPGYPYLAELAQRPEYRNIVETVAEEMTRKWIELKASGGTDKTKQIAAIDSTMKLLGMREAFNRAAELDGFFGMGLIYIDTGATDDPDELKMPLILDPGKIAKGALKGFIPLDPMWVSPKNYNSTNPLRADFFRPSSWYVMGKEIHESRLLMIRSREVPDILKAGYNFGGLSLSQMAKPYVDNWLRTRQSVSDLLHSFTVFVLKTNLASYLGNADQLGKRLLAFVLGRDNQGLMMVDKETEELANVSAPLGSLDALQAQAQEQMASVSQIPIIKLLGITPTGLNSTTDGEIRVWYDRVRAKQEKSFGAAITFALGVIQLSEIGKIDDGISFVFAPLWELDDTARAAVEKMQADTDAVFIGEGVISNEEVRARLAGDPASQYHGLEGPAPEKPDTDTDGVDRIGAEDAAWDKDWTESDHPRGQPENAGQFGPGGGGGGAKKAPGNASHEKSQKVEGKHASPTGGALPAHIAALKIPPAWTDVTYSSDPGASLLATGKDSKGRRQAVYSKEFSETSAEAKFERIHELIGKFKEMSGQNAEAQKSSNPKTKDSADALDLIMKMGVRPGSETDTGAKVKAYGATTLEGRHVVKTESGVSLRFVGKKGVSLDLPVEDKELAAMLMERAEKSGADGKLFPNTSDKAILDHTHTLDGGGFKTKDFRTHVGTSTAYALVRDRIAPKNEAEYKKAVMEIATEVSKRLGNTPVIALQSYISPVVFAEWRTKI